MVNDTFPTVSFEDIVSLYGPNDKFDSNNHVRMLWKYATGMGVNGTPTAFVNGVQVNLAETPSTAVEWNTFFVKLLSNESMTFNQK